ncbi:MAG: S9 family peptidase [Firmicutes bacterium]|nr:S9 family peptidase [Bacillota bacterium]MBE3590603.1 S9 family peptidase [Bacillota bacterium]
MTDRPPSASPARRLEAADLLRLVFLSDVAMRPDGRQAALVRTTVDAEENKYRSQIWVVDLPDGEPCPFTAAGAHRDTHPRYSPDGAHLAFLSNRSGSTQVWVMPTTGGEAEKLTNVDGVEDFVWKDADELVVTVRVGREGLTEPEPKDPPPPKTPEEQDRRYNRDVRVIDRAFYKLDTAGFLGDRRSHLFRLSRRGGELVPLTSGDWDDRDAAVSPDGRWLAFVSKRMPNADFVQASDVYVMPAEGGEPRRLTSAEGYASSPAFTPDGRHVAFLCRRAEGEGRFDEARLYLVPVDGSAPPRCVTPGFDRSLVDASISDTRGHGGTAAPAFAPDGRTAFLLSSDRGVTQIVAVDVESGEVTPLSSRERTVYDAAFARDGRSYVALASDPVTPNDVWYGERPADGGDSLSSPWTERRLTEVNRELLSEVQLQVPERIVFRAPDGPEVEGWILKPVGFREGQAEKVPAVLEVHGGPEAMYTSAFFFEFQLLANHGFAVIFSNPRGSEGYGKAFRQAIHRDWGRKDWADVQALLDAALERGFIDPNRVGIAGGSYGGFMVNWAVGHSDRFRAAVSMRSLSNWFVDYGASDFGHLLDDDLFAAPPWKDPEAYARMSPLWYVENVRTPLLLLHAEEDYRCPVAHAEQFFAALKRLGRTVQLVRYPGESHEMSRSGKPWHRVDRLRRIVGWFTTHLAATAAP